MQTYIERCVCVYLCFSASVPQSRNNKGKSFSWTDSGLFTVIQPGTREQKYPAHRLTIQTKQCFWMCLSPFIALLMQPAASAVQSQPLHVNIVTVCSTNPINRRTSHLKAFSIRASCCSRPLSSIWWRCSWDIFAYLNTLKPNFMQRVYAKEHRKTLWSLTLDVTW